MSNERAQSAHSYRGKRSGPRPHARILLIVLLCLLAVCLILFGIARYLQRYMVYSRDGAFMVLPGETSEQLSARDTSLIDGLVVQEEYAIPVISRENAANLRAIEATVDELLSGSITRQAHDCGANAVVIEMKSSSGVLLWNSNMQTLSYDAVTGIDDDGLPVKETFTASVTVDERADAVERAVEQCRNDGLYLIARVAVLRDDALAAQTGFGEIGTGLIDSSLPVLQDYCASLANELTQLGFDELVLTDLTLSDAIPSDTLEMLPALLSASAHDADQSEGGTTPRIGLEVSKAMLSQNKEISRLLNNSDSASGYARFWLGKISEETLTACFTPEQLKDGSVVLTVENFSPESASCALLMG